MALLPSPSAGVKVRRRFEKKPIRVPKVTRPGNEEQRTSHPYQPGDPPNPQGSENLRFFYLCKTLGLSHDPFAGPVAELEIHSRQNHFFAYYTDPQQPELSKPLPEQLREAQTSLIFGRPGSGKTTLRYTLDAECRSVYDDRTLVVTYELSHKMTQLPDADKHWANLAVELAIDLFIQVLEQLEILGSISEEQKQQLREQMILTWPRLHRTVRRILEDDFSNQENGLASLWPRLNRSSAARYIHRSQKIIDLLKEWQPQDADRLVSPTPVMGEALLQAGLAAAKAWGFRRIFVLVDGVDAHHRDTDSMLKIVAPLLDNMARWQKQNLFFHFFLTEEMKEPISRDYGQSLASLPVRPLFYSIWWDYPSLAELLRQRLRAAGGRVSGFRGLVAADIAHRLEDRLIQAADNSPRQLLRLVSALIDAHAHHASDQPLITAEDWRRMQQVWGYGPPLPPDLAG